MDQLPNGLVQIGSNRYWKSNQDKDIVYSYGQIVLIRVRGDRERLYQTSQFWSITTSRHIIQVKQDYFPHLIPELISQFEIDRMGGNI